MRVDTSNPVVPEGPAGTPTFTSPVHAKAGNTKATVTWSPAVVPTGTTITGYLVTASPGGRTCHTTGATTCVVTGLTNGTTYTFTVVASYSAGASETAGPSNKVTPEGAKLTVRIVLEPFATASWTLTASMKRQLLNLSKIIAKHGAKSVSVDGYTDSRGGVAPNLTLGLERAKSAKAFLRAALSKDKVGASTRLVIASLGLTHAAESNATPAGMAKNRRVVIFATLLRA